MKALFIFVAACMFAVRAPANLYTPNAKLAGETVSVRLLADSAIVTAVFQFADWWTKDDKVIYFPIFAADSDPLRVLAAAKFELQIEGKKIDTAFPCDAPPREFKNLPKNVRVFWYSMKLDESLVFEDIYSFENPPVIKATYIQPLIAGKFYYLPVITGATQDSEKRAWNYQMHARSAVKMIRVGSLHPDYLVLGDAVTVYLRDGEVVILE
jgi:hypothetical protein